MPMCHANSLYFFGAFTYCGGACSVYTARASIPSTALTTLAEGGATFTSLVPTHYIMMLGCPPRSASGMRPRPGEKLMISSAPARPRHQARGHGDVPATPACSSSTARPRPAGSPCSSPHEQFTKLGSVGRECVGSAPIRLLDEDGNEVAGRRGRRALFLQPLHVRRLLEAAREDRGSVPRRVLHGRRHGPPRRGRLHPSRRPQEQHDHLRRRERLSVRGRGGCSAPTRR